MTPPAHRQCAATIIRNAAGEVLLVQQNYGTHAWGTPGGVVEPGETPMEAAIRKTSEEVGLNVTLSHLIRIPSNSRTVGTPPPVRPSPGTHTSSFSLWSD